MSGTGVLFSDMFNLTDVDMIPDPKNPGKLIKDKKFDKVNNFLNNKVSRIMAKSETYVTELTLDVNTQIYPMCEGDKFQLLLADTLEEIGSQSEAGYDPTREPSIRLQQYDYVMHGKIFKYAEDHGKAIVYASFGGLLMSLKSEPHTLGPQSFEVDRNLFLLIKKSEM